MCRRNSLPITRRRTQTAEGRRQDSHSHSGQTVKRLHQRQPLSQSKVSDAKIIIGKWSQSPLFSNFKGRNENFKDFLTFKKMKWLFFRGIFFILPKYWT